MKNLLLLLISVFIALNSTFTTYASVVCDQVFENRFLRYNYAYGFWDQWNNDSNNPVYLNKWSVDYTNPEYLDMGVLYDNGKGFDWTNTLRNNGFQVNPNSSMRVLSTRANDWKVDQYPAERTNATRDSFDFAIHYTIDYDFSNNYPNASDDVSHTECVYYSVTRCGDGVVDTWDIVGGGTDSEQCDDGNNINGDGCSNTCELNSNPEIPQISITKLDGNTADLDGDIGDDTQTVYIGDDATFRIIVRNSGTEGLEDIQVTDPLAPSCNLNISEALSYIQATGNSDNIFDPGESFSYFCTKNNTQDNYTNEIFVTGVGVNSGTNVDSDDTTEVVSRLRYDLALVKTLSNTTPGPFKAGNEVSFVISVTNQGDVDANNIEITDYIPTGLTLVSGSSWTQSGNQAKQIIAELLAGQTKTRTITFTIDSNAPENIRNFAEISVDDGNDCDSTPDAIHGNGTDGKGETEATGMVDNEDRGGCTPNGDEDDHDFEDIVVEAGIYDLALVKTLTTQENIYYPGDTVIFDIEIFNQGDTDSGRVEITDYIPEGLTLVEIALLDQNREKIGKLQLWDETGTPEKQRMMTSDISPGTSKIIQISFTVNEDAPETIRNFAEISNDDGDDCDSTPDAINGNGTDGEGETEATGMVDNEDRDGCTQNGDEDDHDFEDIVIGEIIPEEYDLALKKTLYSTGALERGGEVTFMIEVFNQGDLDSGIFSITDYIPEGLTLSDASWTQTGNIATKAFGNIPAGSSREIFITFTVDADAPESISNYAEIHDDSGFDCDSVPNQNISDDALVDDEIGLKCDTDEGDEDDHDIAIITLPEIQFPSVYLIKSLADGQETNVAVGDEVHYVITVYNTGSMVAESQRIEDHYRDASNGGLALLENDDWTDTDNDGVAEYKELVDIPANGNVEFDIYFTITDQAEGQVRNLAVVCDSDEEDCEPVDPPTCDDEDEVGNPEGCVEVVVGDPSIMVDKTDANPDDQNSSNDIQKVNQGDRAVFKIRVTNDGTENLRNITLTDARAPNCAGDVTLPNSYPSTWSDFTTGGNGNKTDNVLEPGEWFEYTCEKANTQSDYTNTVDVTADGVDSEEEVSDSDDSRVELPGGGTSGGTYRCNDIVQQSSGDIRCYGNSKVESFYIQGCSADADGNYSIDSSIKEYSTESSTGRRYADFSCDNPVAQCKVYDDYPATIGSDAFRGGNTCLLNTTPACGNGVLEAGEECETTQKTDSDGNPLFNLDGSPDLLPFPTNNCYSPGNTRECQLKDINSSNGGDTSCEDDNSCVRSWPEEGKTYFGPVDSVIIGHKQNPYNKIENDNNGVLGTYPYIINDSPYDIGYKEMCVRVSSQENSLTDFEQCLTVPGGVIYAYEKLYMVEKNNTPTLLTQYDLTDPSITSLTIRGNKTEITGDFATGNLITTATRESTYTYSINPYEDYYFIGKTDVRVAKPAISTVGGGTSYVKSDDTADVAEITDNITNTNFVGSSVNDGTETISSDSVEVDNSVAEVIDEINNSKDDVEQSKEVINTDSVSTATLENYNGLDNVFIYKGADFTASNLPDLNTISTPRTYIIEDGDLIIDENISANKNIAFVVRGGNIVIQDNVTEIDGTYITIPKDGVLDSGKIKAVESGKQLVVNGSLYGNITQLVNNRYYISDSGDGLSVGTIVSFGSGLFTKPAPLVSQFVGEYLQSEKVAK